MKPDDYWTLEPQYAEAYQNQVTVGREVAARSSACFLAIARNAMPYLENTLALLEESRAMFSSSMFYVYENDSTDETDDVLQKFASARDWAIHEHATLHRPDYRGFEEDRTIALAEYRNRCRRWALENAPQSDYVIVLDMDPQGGFSPDGIMNSIGWLSRYASESCRCLAPAGMASNSLLVSPLEEPGKFMIAAYDAWAARLNWWEDRRNHRWFHELMLPPGSPPIPMNSAFGGLAVYRGQAFFADGVEYVGGDCEHVGFHRSMQRAGYQLFLNPGSRYVAIYPNGVQT